LVAYGYGLGQKITTPLPDVKDSLEISEDPDLRYEGTKTPVVLVSTGPTVVGEALPHANPKDRRFNQEGVAKRFGYNPPVPNGRLRRRFRRFVERWLKKNLLPLSPDVDTSFDSWLQKTNYPEWRKQELRECWEMFGPDADYDYSQFFLKRCNSFPKDECYGEYKFPRLINARHDWFKCKSGPIFKLIESELFKLPWFIKKVPVADRPAYIKTVMEGVSKAVATDYTSFEALFTKDMMQDCEMLLYSYMIQHLNEQKEILAWLVILVSENVCKFKDFKVGLKATRMSGEMCTSLGNSFSNLMFMLFIAEENGNKHVRGVVEGDDGLFTMTGVPPTAEQFEALGLKIKLEVHDKLTTASFCGLVFDPDDCVNVTNPRKMLVAMGWTSSKYAGVRTTKMRGLLRSKALSAAYQYPGCPIIAHAARAYLRLTAGADTTWYEKQLDWWEREKLEQRNGEIPWIEPPTNTRLLVEELYGLTVSEQLAVEHYFDNLTELAPLYVPFASDAPKDWRDYWETYVAEINVRSREVQEEVRLHEMLPGYQPQVKAAWVRNGRCYRRLNISTTQPRPA